MGNEKKIILELSGVTKRFGGLEALSDINAVIYRGEILGLIGPNGSGKTTLFNCITGVLPLTEGRIILDGMDITGMKSWKIARRGVSRSYQIVQPFQYMSAVQNVMVGVFNKRAAIVDGEMRDTTDELSVDQDYLRSINGEMRVTPDERSVDMDEHRSVGGEMRDINKKSDYYSAKRTALRYLAMLGMAEKSDVLARHLNLGERKKLEIAKALATEPVLLLLDEVMAGLTATEAMEIIEIVRNINRSGITVIMIEHNMDTIMAACERLIVLNFGKKIMEGTPEEVVMCEKVVDAYLGQGYGD